jgi:peptide/nickel transport system permease protein
MINYLFKRLVALLPTALVPIVFIFFLVRLAPGDPARNILGDYATEEDVIALRHQLGLDRPLLTQFFDFVTSVFRGDLGESFYMFDKVSHIIPPYASVTLQIGVMAMIFAFVLGVGLGNLIAFKRKSWIGKAARTIALVGISTPSFFIAILVIVILAIKLQFFAVGLYASIESGYIEHFKSLFMPSISLGIAEAAFIARVVSGALNDVMNEPFVTTARSLGVKESRIITIHIMRLVSLQVITVMGLFAASLISGSVIMENIFGIPGLGSVLLNAVTNRDYFLIQGVVIMTGTFIIIFNLIVDLLYAVIDPRVQYQGEVK